MNTSIDITIDPSPDRDLLDVDSLQDPRSLSRRSSLRASITSVDFSKTEFQLDVSIAFFNILIRIIRFIRRSTKVRNAYFSAACNSYLLI